MLLLKLDIVKAFDSVRWEYLIELMEQLGFGQRWRDLASLIWSTTTSRIMLNGQPVRPIKHSLAYAKVTLCLTVVVYSGNGPAAKSTRHGNKRRFTHPHWGSADQNEDQLVCG
jgi:hypothetical protein